jgi:hypothetical protein
MTCQEFDRIESDYLAGALSDIDARAFEAHAAGCPACGQRLGARTRRDVSAFAPSLPPALRASTLAAVRRHRAQQDTRRWWGGGITAAAAAVALAVGVSRYTATPAERAAPMTAARDSAPSTPADSALSPSVTLAMLSSRDEFAALDAAIRELEAALSTSPADAELRAFLASAVARRAELQRQVKDAA